jgi:sugar phosphate permease
MVPIMAKAIPKKNTRGTTDLPQGQSSVFVVFRSRTVWLACLCFCGYDLINYGLSSWTPSYLMEVKKLNIVSSGALTAIPPLLSIVPVILGGFIFDKVGYKRPSLIIVPAAMACGAFLCLMVQSVSVTEFIVYQGLSSLVLAFAFIPIFGLSLRTLNPVHAGMGNAVINFGGQIAGAFAPFGMGFLADRFGYTVAFCLPIVGVAIMVVSVFLLPNASGAGRETRASA